MTDNSILWQALQAYIPKKTWIPLSDVLATVRSRVTLDKEDLERKDLPAGPRDGNPTCAVCSERRRSPGTFAQGGETPEKVESNVNGPAGYPI
jgi:hypothetical protein